VAVTVSDEVVANGKIWSVNSLKRWVLKAKILTKIRGLSVMGNNDAVTIKKVNTKSNEPF
jgi:hypothetical protein